MPIPPSVPSADRNLLLGILALQLNFIDQDRLIAAMKEWVFDKSASLGQILQRRNLITAERAALLETLVSEHLKAYQNDSQRSLVALPAARSVYDRLRAIEDEDLQASLAGAGPESIPVGDTTSDYHASREGRFQILRPLARGGLGEVFIAEDIELHREVALKEITERHAREPASRRRFVLEAEITGRLEHPGIVPVYGLGHYPDGRPFYAMRFIRGDNLKEAIARFHSGGQSGQAPGQRRLDMHLLLRRFVDVCNAVAYAHSRGILHRDLKPANIMLGKYGETLVVDWGLAKALGRADVAQPSEETPIHPSSDSSDAATRMGTAIGTPAYMSPEQAQGRWDEVGPQSDVYSLGATLYVLLTGKPPFVGDAAEIARKVERGDFPAPRQVNPSVAAALDAVCRKAMSSRQADRFKSALALAEDIEAWLADEPVAAYRDPLTTRLARWARQHRMFAAGSAVALLAAVVFLTALAGVLDNARRASLREQARTEEARQKAATARKRTREALDQVSSEAIANLLTQQQELTKAHIDFLRKALSLYQELAEEVGDDPQTRLEVANAYGRMAGIRFKLGETAEAEAAYRRWIELARDLQAEPTPSHRAVLAVSLAELGDVLIHLNRFEEARKLVSEALNLRKQMSADAPDDARSRAAMAYCVYLVGHINFNTGQIDAAKDKYVEGIGVYRELIKQFPENAHYRDQLVSGCYTVGIAWWRLRKIKEAEAAFREGVATQRELCADFPKERQYRQTLAAAINNLSTFIAAEGNRVDESLPLHHEAIAIRKQLAAEFPAVPRYRAELARSYNNLGIALQSRPKQTAEAYAALQSATALQKQLAGDFPDVVEYRNALAMTTFTLGRLHEIRNNLNEAEICFRECVTAFQKLCDHPQASSEYRGRLTQSKQALDRVLQKKAQKK